MKSHIENRSNKIRQPIILWYQKEIKIKLKTINTNHHTNQLY